MEPGQVPPFEEPGNQEKENTGDIENGRQVPQLDIAGTKVDGQEGDGGITDEVETRPVITLVGHVGLQALLFFLFREKPGGVHISKSKGFSHFCQGVFRFLTPNIKILVGTAGSRRHPLDYFASKRYDGGENKLLRIMSG
jgi:hypothetical protein